MRAAVIGAGRMGTFHRRALTDLGFDVTTVDPDPAARADYVSLRPRPMDAVCIATPIPYLAEMAMAWAPHAGALLIEKPMAHSAAAAIALAAALEGRRAAVGYCERFNPEVLRLRDRMRAARGPWAGTFTRWNLRSSPDPLLDLMSHDVDLAAFLGVLAPVHDVRAPASTLVRRIDVSGPDGQLSADLLAHATSPIHAMWAALLAGVPGAATPADAVAVLEVLGRAMEDVA